MAGRIDFFCDGEDERRLLRFATAAGDMVLLDVNVHDVTKLSLWTIDDVPAWPEPARWFLWLRSGGSLHWHVHRPQETGSSHGEVVANVLAVMTWDRLQPPPGRGFIDSERSPVLLHDRPVAVSGLYAPSAIICPASTPDRVSRAFSQWRQRLFGWIRRNGVLIHSWKKPNDVLRNDLQLLNSIYVLPGALADFRRHPSQYAISVDR